MDSKKVLKVAVVLLPVFWPNLPPLSLAYLKGFLKKQGVEVDAIDLNNFFYNLVSEDIRKEWRQSCNKEFEKNIITILRSDYPKAFQVMLDRLFCYDIIGFSCYKSNFIATRQISRLIKEKKPELRLIPGGPEITGYFFKYKDQLIRRFEGVADFIVVGEGELPLYQYITNENPLSSLSTSPSSNIAVFKERDNLDDNPDFSDFDLDSYPRKSSISLILSRGCIKKCRFCAERLIYKRFRLTPVAHIIEQLRDLKSRGITNFVFHDSLINGALSWLEDLCDAIIHNFGSINWEAQLAIRGDMPDQLLSKMKQSGCYHLFIGLESGCAKTLKNMNKGYTPREALAFFKQLNKAGLSFGVSILVGFPGETQGDFMESLQFVLEYKEWIPKIEQINPFVYYDGLCLSVSSDYKSSPQSLERASFFITKIKEEGLKSTKSFLLNLVEPEWRSEKLKSPES